MRTIAVAVLLCFSLFGADEKEPFKATVTLDGLAVTGGIIRFDMTTHDINDAFLSIDWRFRSDSYGKLLPLSVGYLYIDRVGALILEVSNSIGIKYVEAKNLTVVEVIHPNFPCTSFPIAKIPIKVMLKTNGRFGIKFGAVDAPPPGLPNSGECRP